MNHGIFLEIVLLLTKTDINLNDHVNNAIVESKKRTKGKGTGRGSLFTFLSPTTIANIIQSIHKLMLNKISEEVNSVGEYSITMDSTMDISTHDQCVFVLRYVRDTVNDNISRIDVIERVVALKKAVSSSGQALFDLLRITLNSMNINLKNCIADAFDGAANMNGQNQGVQAKLKEVSPRHIHTWCYAHILNLVLQQTIFILCDSYFIFWTYARIICVF